MHSLLTFQLNCGLQMQQSGLLVLLDYMRLEALTIDETQFSSACTVHGVVVMNIKLGLYIYMYTYANRLKKYVPVFLPCSHSLYRSSSTYSA